MSKSIVLEKAIAFALRIVRFYRHLTDDKKEFVLSKMVLISGTFVAKHVREATAGEGRPNFSKEMFIAMKRAIETEFWLLMIHEGGWLDEKQYDSMRNDCVELIKMTSAISKTTRDDETPQ